MASQRLFIATLGGKAAEATADLFAAWHRLLPTVNEQEIDGFCEALRANSTSLQVLYSCEWIDRWLMGDTVPGPNKIPGRRYDLTVLSPKEAAEWAAWDSFQFEEQEWFSNHLREAARAWAELVERRIVVVVREVFGATATDDEILQAIDIVPPWLANVVAANEWQKQELERRKARFSTESVSGLSWEEVKARIRSRNGR
jgi:hypothetical protein